MSAADLPAPALAGAALGIEITQTIRIADQEYSTVRISVPAGSFLDGQKLGALEDENDREIVLVQEGDKLVIDPERDVPIAAGNGVLIFARHDRVLEVVSRNRKSGKG